MTRVSIVVPLFNKGAYISRALDSISRQTFQDFEVIVVDDGSSDDSRARASAHTDRRVRILSQANAGPGAARNRGIADSQGELLAFLDADDEWRPEYLLSAVKIFDDQPEVAATTCGYIDYPAAKSTESMWRKRGIHPGMQRLSARTSPILFSHMLAYMSPCSTVARAQVVRQYGGFYDKGPRFGEDSILWLKILLNEAVYFRLEPLACFHREASELSGNYRAARPVEPFLLWPMEVRSVCPAELLPLLGGLYATRACKTATMLAYWGQWREAQRLLNEFVSWKDWRLPYFATAIAGSTPLGGMLGGLLSKARAAKAIGRS